MRPHRQPSPRAPRRAAAVATLLLILAVAGVGAGLAAELPPAAARLLPAQPHALLVFSSLDAADAAWQLLADLDRPEAAPDDAAVEGEDVPAPGNEETPLSVGAMPVPRPRAPGDLVNELAPGFADLIDRTRPVAIAFTLPAPMTQGGAAPVLALPLRDRKLDERKVRKQTGAATVLVRDGYAAVTRDSAYTPGGEDPALLAGLPAAAVVARVDLAGVIAMYRPLVEMVLPMLGQPGAFGEPGPDGAVAPAMPPAQLAMLQGFLGGFFDSARRLDLSLDARDDGQRLGLTFAVAPGSVMDPGPQPDFASALALSRLLPPGFSVYQAWAADATRSVEFFGPLQRESMAMQTQALPPAIRDGYLQWIDDSLELAKMPMISASALSATGSGLRSRMIVSDADPEAFVARMIAFYGRLDTLQMGFRVTEAAPETIDGVTVRSFSLGIDEQQLARLAVPPAGGEPAADAAADSVALAPIRRMAHMLRSFCPALRVATLPGLVVTCVDSDPAAMAEQLAWVRAGGGAVPPALQAAADGGGTGTQWAVSGDLASLFRAIVAAAEPALAGDAEAPPASFAACGGLRGSELDVTLTGDTRGLSGLFGSLQALAKAQAAAGDDAAGDDAGNDLDDDAGDDTEGD